MVAAYKTPKTNRTAPGFYRRFIDRFDMNGELFFNSLKFKFDKRIINTLHNETHTYILFSRYPSSR